MLPVQEPPAWPQNRYVRPASLYQGRATRTHVTLTRRESKRSGAHSLDMYTGGMNGFQHRRCIGAQRRRWHGCGGRGGERASGTLSALSPDAFGKGLAGSTSASAGAVTEAGNAFLAAMTKLLRKRMKSSRPLLRPGGTMITTTPIGMPCGAPNWQRGSGLTGPRNTPLLTSAFRAIKPFAKRWTSTTTASGSR